MSDVLTQFLNSAFGSTGSPDALTLEHMVVRAVVIYCIGLVIVRIGKNRLLGRSTGFDIVLAFILGSLLSRGINGAAPPVPTLVAAMALVMLHWLVSALSLRSARFERLVKGTQAILIQNGQLDRQMLRRKEVSEKDVAEVLRLNTNTEDLGRVHNAYLERNGQISTVLRTPRVVEVEVRDGVQTVRLEFAS